MKNIFVPFDFSEPARNAAEYAVQLAMFFDAKMTLFHSFQLPVVTGEASFIQYPYDELYNENLTLLKKARAKLQKGIAKDVPIDCIVKNGFAGSNIVDESAAGKFNLVVMGITEKNKMGELLIGSNSVYVARHSEVPVLIVPEDVKYKKIRKIAFACDYEETEEGGLLDDVRLWQFVFEAELDVVNVYDESKVPTLEKATTGLAVENTLSNTSHHTHFIQNENPAEGLQEYLSTYNPDLLIVVPKKHSIFNSLFHESITKSLAFHAHLPILALHQKSV
jgi:nucleotide-binding universal stress UspA family protein